MKKNDDAYIKFIESNYNYLTAKLFHPTPFVLFLGAGASFGSDNKRLFLNGKLPPLGKDLYEHLIKSSNLVYWKQIPEGVQEMFNINFEQGLEYMMDNDEKYKMFYKLLIELALYFTQFEPEKSNLYVKLAQRIYKRKSYISLISLNYDYMLQNACFSNLVFPNAIGVQDTDIRGHFDNYHPIDVIYPHGACQFPYRCPNDWETEVYNGTMEVLGGGLHHFYQKINIVSSYRKQEKFSLSLPLMCAYEPRKRSFSKNDFIELQRKYYSQTILGAKRIVIVGVNCNSDRDKHIWEPLNETKADIFFIEPSVNSIKKIKAWNKNASIIQKNFKDGFENICEIIDI